MQRKLAICVIWFAFVLRGLFYCSFLPLWEGYDEWAHFSYIQKLAVSGAALVDREEPVSREVGESLRMVPVARELRGVSYAFSDGGRILAVAGSTSGDAAECSKQMPRAWAREPDTGGLRIYEALQPPLYYWAMSAMYRLAGNLSLPDRVYLLRYISLLIGSLVVPLTYSGVAGPLVAFGATVLVALMPELMVDLCRVGNECLGIVLYSLLTLLCLEWFGAVPARWTGVRLGAVLGLGLLTKAYFLTALPAVAVLWVWMLWRSDKKIAVLYQGTAAAGSALLVAGWWYRHNLLTTGTWSGLSESVTLLHCTPGEYLLGAARLPWPRAVDSILVSHIWYGAWSSLLLRSWIYHVFFGVVAVAAAGVAAHLWRGRGLAWRPVYPLLSVYGFLWLGQLYNVLLLFLSKGLLRQWVGISIAWHRREAALLAVGLLEFVRRGHRWPLYALGMGLAALDLYSVHFVSIPYYSGLTSHLGNGAVGAFHLGQLQEVGVGEIFRRLSVNKASWLREGTLEGLWVCYCVAMLLLFNQLFRQCQGDQRREA